MSSAVLALVALCAATQAQQSVAASSVRVLPVAANVWMISGDGGNIAVQSGADGVVVVDTGAGQKSADVLQAVRTIARKPIRYIINTTASRDHVGGNATLAEAGEPLGSAGGAATALVAGSRGGAQRLAHENVLLRMSASENGKPLFPEATWPTEGYIDTKNLYLNGEAVQLMHHAATSDGDSIVFFRKSDVLVTGPIVDATRFPFIDVARGGSIQGEIAALNKLIELAVPPTPLVWQEGGTRVIPGRGHLLEQADLVEYRDMLTIIRDVVQGMIDKRMTLSEIHAAEPTKGYTRRYGATTGSWTTRMFVDAVYSSLKVQ